MPISRQRRAKILRCQGWGPKYAHISTNTRRNNEVTFLGKAKIGSKKSGPRPLFHGHPKWRYGPDEALGRVGSPRNGAEKKVIEVFVASSDPYSVLSGPT